jgi:hypothetical protein
MNALIEEIVVAARFNGPPASGNGGYVGGLLAARIGAPAVEVTLRAPPPLDRPLQLRATPAGGLALFDAGTLLAEAVASALELEVPTPPGPGEAQAAGELGRRRAEAGIGNPYMRCFGCGIARHDGLRLLPTPAGPEGVVAASWTPDASLADAEGAIPPEIVWTALDCPAGFAWTNRLQDAPPLVTGRITASVDLAPRAGERYTVIGWPIAQDGRKLHAGTAIVDTEGRVRARSRQLWMIPKTA